MAAIIRGARSRPRVAFLGEFNANDIEYFERICPTVWLAATIEELNDMVAVKEIDLLIIGSAVKSAGRWPEHTHVICFSHNVTTLPGPTPYTLTHLGAQTDTEEYELPDTITAFDRRRRVDLGQISNTKGWGTLYVDWQPYMPVLPQTGARSELEIAEEILTKGPVVSDHHTGKPFAVIYQRSKSHLGVAWLPNPVFNQRAWVELIAIHWAESDRERFPEFGDWTKSPAWMTPEEEVLVYEISQLEERKRIIVEQIDREIGEARTKLAEATLAANRGRRRLISAQGNELVDEVADVFAKFGFNVQRVDELIPPEALKREDLRLRDASGANPDWEAIVEVRGYESSGGKTADLQRLGRFADFYREEKGHLPDRRIYVVNGQIGLPPHQRQVPLVSSPDDLTAFSENNGIVISTLDLFSATKLLDHCGPNTIRDSIIHANGRWTYNP